MKKILLSTVFALLSCMLYSQSEFKPELKVKFPIDVNSKSINSERTLVLGSNNKEAVMIDMNTGKTMWQVTFLDKLKEKKAKYVCYEEVSGRVRVDVDGGKDLIKSYYLDEKTGEVIDDKPTNTKVATNTKAANSGNRFNLQHSFYSSEKNVTIDVSYKERLIASSAGSHSVNLTIKAAGAYNWEINEEVEVVRSLCTNSGLTSDITDLMTVYTLGDKVFLVYDGVTVLDIATGKKLWQTGFDYADFSFGLTKCSQLFPRAALPIVKNNLAYVVNLKKEERKLKAIDVNTGSIVWESEKYDGDAVVSELFVSDNSLIIHFGGKVIKQVYKPGMGNGSVETCSTELENQSNSGLKAYELTTGKIIWTTYDRKDLPSFKDKTTNIAQVDGKLIVATEKFIYALDPKTGSVVYSIPTKTLKLGTVTGLFGFNDKVLVDGEDGIASISPKDGKVIYAVNTNKNCYSEFKGDKLIVWNDDNIFDLKGFIALDPISGTVYGKQKDTRYPYFSSNGDYFIKFNGNKEVLKFRIN